MEAGYGGRIWRQDMKEPGPFTNWHFSRSVSLFGCVSLVLERGSSGLNASDVNVKPEKMKRAYSFLTEIGDNNRRGTGGEGDV